MELPTLLSKILNVQSPLTSSYNTKFIRSIPSDIIKDLYLHDYNVSVDRFFDGVDKIEIYQCNDTGYRFYMPTSVISDAQLYIDLEASGMYYANAEDWQHLQVSRALKPPDSILEIGCGNGFWLKDLRNKGFFDVQGIDINPSAIEVAANSGVSAYNISLANFADLHQESFDIVCAFQVLEHIADVKSFISDCVQLLKKGGKLFIAVPNNNPYLYKFDVLHTLNLPPHHMGLWNEESLRSIENIFKLKTIDVLVEPLQSHEAAYYSEVIGSRIGLASLRSGLAKKTLLKMCSYLIKLNPSTFAGRNLLASFEKY